MSLAFKAWAPKAPRDTARAPEIEAVRRKILCMGQT